MASFTDSISQFNPYVQQLPVDLMMKVGMQKQAQYDQGVQKVQSYIDNVAGIDIAHESDKEYLHSKLGELGGKLKTVAAGDFSNQQVVNSVSGMANQIMKDNNIQNAVYSTANMKKQNEMMEYDRKKGTLDKAGEYIYNKEAEGYLSSKQVGQKFNGKYSGKLSDWSKKILDTIKTLQPNATQEDLAYAINPTTGLPDYNAIAVAMQRHSKEVVDEGKIRSALNAVLNTDDLEQMRKEGIYNLRGYDKDQFAKLAVNTAEVNKDIYTKRLHKLYDELRVSTDPDQQLELKAAIDAYKKQVGDEYEGVPSQLNADLISTLDLIGTDKGLDAAKSKLFVQNTIDQYSNAFAWAKIKNEIMTSPLQQQKNWDEEQMFKRVQEDNLEFDRAQGRWVAKEKLKIEKTKEVREAEKYETEKKTTVDANGNVVYSGVGDETTQKNEAFKNWVSNKNKYVAQNGNILKQLKNELGGFFTDATDSEVLTKIANYEKDPAKNKPKTVQEKQLMDSYIANRDYIANQDKMSEGARQKALTTVTGGKPIAVALSEDLKKLGNVNLYVGGKAVEFTPAEILNYLTTKEYARVVTQAGAAQGGSSIAVKDELLTAKEKLLKQALKGRYISGRAESNFLQNELSKYGEVTKKYKDIQRQVDGEYMNNLSPYTGVFKSEKAGITFDKDNTAENLIRQLKAKVSADASQSGGGKGYDTDGTIESLNKDKASDVLGLNVFRRGGEYFIEVDDAGKIQQVPVTAEFVRKNIGQKYLNKGITENEMLFTQGNRTNPTNDINLSQYKPNNFTNYVNGQPTVTLPIYMDLINNGNGNAALLFHLKNRKGDVIDIPWTDSNTSVAKISNWVGSQTDETLLPLLRRLYPNVDKFLKQ